MGYGRFGLRMAGLAAAVMAGLAGGALGAPLTGKQAKTLIFGSDGVSVEVLAADQIDASMRKILQAVAEQQPWYSAIALSPDEDIMTSKATVAGAQFHDTDAASAFALAGCEALRTGESPCLIVALVRPKGWKAQPLPLSLAATEFFRAEYLPSAAPKAMATSAATGLWGFATGAGAAESALADCAGKGSDVQDCAVVIAD